MHIQMCSRTSFMCSIFKMRIKIQIDKNIINVSSFLLLLLWPCDGCTKEISVALSPAIRASDSSSKNIKMFLLLWSLLMTSPAQYTLIKLIKQEWISFAKVVCRGFCRPPIVGDLPFGTFKRSINLPITSAMRLVKQTQIDFIKLESARF